jgi:hypothetical protein
LFFAFLLYYWYTVTVSVYRQWKEGDEVPSSWREYYIYNPCVPIDYLLVNSAVAVAQGRRAEQVHNIRVLIRPGTHYLREAITIHANNGVLVEMETMELPLSYTGPIEQPPDEVEQLPSTRGKSSSLRNFNFLCRTAEVEEAEEEPPIEFPANVMFMGSMETVRPLARRATLVLKTRRHNEPIVRIRQGALAIRNVELRHVSLGIGEYIYIHRLGKRNYNFLFCGLTHVCYLSLQIFGAVIRRCRSSLLSDLMINP